MEYPTSKEVTRELLNQIIDKYPVELAEVLMERKPYIRDMELLVLQNPNCELMVGLKVSAGRVQVLNVTLTHKYISQNTAGNQPSKVIK